MTATGAAPDGAHMSTFLGHPRGLPTLFFTEMWERFSYYGMRALLVLFMTAPAAAGGLEFDAATAGAVYGTYTALVYLTSVPGGWIADRVIGAHRAVLSGGVLIAAGHFSMALPALPGFYAGLLLIVVGTGLLKPNISVMVGQLYEDDDGRRDAGFSLFYMGINLGGFIAPLVCGYLGQRIDWHYGFAAAGVGMTIGLAQYAIGRRHLRSVGAPPASAGTPAHTRTARRTWMTVAAVAGVTVTFGLAVAAGTLSVTPLQVSTAIGYLLLAVTVAFFAWLFLDRSWTRDERRRLYLIGALFVAAALFWSVFEQAGSTLNLFADRGTTGTLAGMSFPSTWFQSLNPIFVIVFAPAFAWLWLRLGARNPSSPVKFSLGLIGAGAGFLILVPAAWLVLGGDRVSPSWLVATYLVHTFAELCLSPVGLSSMTRLAPARVVGLMMGVWFLASSVGNYIGGRIGGRYESLPLDALFGRVGLFALVAGVVMLALSKRLARLMH